MRRNDSRFVSQPSIFLCRRGLSCLWNRILSLLNSPISESSAFSWRWIPGRSRNYLSCPTTFSLHVGNAIPLLQRQLVRYLNRQAYCDTNIKGKGLTGKAPNISKTSSCTGRDSTRSARSPGSGRRGGSMAKERGTCFGRDISAGPRSRCSEVGCLVAVIYPRS